MTSLDARAVLRRLDPRIAALRRLLAHDHGDEAFWARHGTTAPAAQRERVNLRFVANLLHVERATHRGRIHGTRFATLDEQRTWLASYEDRWGILAIPGLRAGELLDLPVGAR
jgi:hypothetical protein